MQYVASNQPRRADRTSLVAEFQKYDANGDGLLDKLELQTCLSINIPIGAHRLFNMKCIEYLLSKFGTITLSKGYVIDLSSFSRVVQYVDEILEKFRRFDHRKLERISYNDLCLVFAECGLVCDEAIAQQIGTMCDIDGNGTLEFDEFCLFFIEWEFYGNVFRAVDKDNSGSISAFELASMLSELQPNLVDTACARQWAGRRRQFSHQTMFALLMKFGGDNPTALPELDIIQFGQLLTYLNDLKDRFLLHRTSDNKITAAELQAVFSNMGLNAPEKFILKIGEQYDEDKNGTLEFDEFCRLIIEWDQYIELFTMCASGDESPGLTPLDLQKALCTMPDVSTFPPGMSQEDFVRNWNSKLFDAAHHMRDFNLNTCILLVSHFSASKASLTLLEFREVLEFVNGLKQQFRDIDLLKDDRLCYMELRRAFTFSGLCLSEASLIKIMGTYDVDLKYHDDKPALLFDSFVQLNMELALHKTTFNALSTNGMLNLNFENMVDLIYQIPRVA
eukprot:GEMP01043454.1.p1 GENE.GEMP01043454.1~~GEMP01043454.1.p1  ORF type:complete len:505 (+),score=72.27 GEMP01043454.1:120-1634(+)